MEGLGVEVPVELAVDDRQNVAIEGGRHAGRVVVGRHEPARVLDQISAQEQGVVGPRPGPQGCEQVVPFGRPQVPDRPAEENDQPPPPGGQETDVLLKVPDHPVHDHAGVLPGKLRAGGRQHRVIHVERHDAAQASARRQGVEEEAGLLGCPRSQLDEGLGTGQRGDLARAGAQDRALAPSRVVLRQASYLVKQPASRPVVEPLGRQLLRHTAQAGPDVCCQCRRPVGLGQMPVEQEQGACGACRALAGRRGPRGGSCGHGTSSWTGRGGGGPATVDAPVVNGEYSTAWRTGG